MVQTGSCESEYGTQTATSQQSAHLRVLLQGRQHQGMHPLLQTDQLRTEQAGGQTTSFLKCKPTKKEILSLHKMSKPFSFRGQSAPHEVLFA